MKLTKFAVASALMIQASFAWAGGVEVLVGQSLGKKGGDTYTLDVLSDGRMTAFQFDVEFPGVPTKAIDLSKCGGASTKKFGVDLTCNMVEGKVRVVGLSMSLQTLPEGWHNLGAIRVSSKQQVTAQISGLLAGDPEGRAISSGSKVESID
ncbi:MAG: hypothetical protein KDJ14_02720 [Xanthomonadales bacterium]|nr:hypothetical protein [Xanthomonadales bacterium]